MRIFICYRREDAAGHAGRLYDQLSSHFGADSVFIDVAGIEPGADFVSVVEETVARSDAVLVVMGPAWLTARADDGARRIDQPDDYLRREIASALAHGCRVVPVLVRQSTMPQPADLPSPIQELARRNAIEVRDTRWHNDVDTLVRNLQTAVPDSRPRGALWWLDPSNWPSLSFDWIFSALAILLVTAGYFDAWINRHLPVKPWEHAPVQAVWLLITLCLAATATIRWLRTRRPELIVPKGYLVSVIGCIVFALGILSNIWWSLVFGVEIPGLPAIFRPPNLLQIVGGGLIVIGPLRAALARRELQAGPTALISATLLLATVTFFSQFDHPYINPWAYDRHQLPTVFDFVGEELGPLSLFVQATIVTGTILFILRQIRLLPGSIAFMLTATAAFVCAQFGNFQFIVVAAVVGILSDLLLVWARPRPGRFLQLRAFAASMAALLAAVYLVEVWFIKGVYWRADIAYGTVFVCGAIGWLMSYLTFPDRQAGEAAAVLWSPGS